MPEIPIRAAILTVSDSRRPEDDVSGAKLRELLSETGASVVVQAIVTDDRESLESTISAMADRDDVDLVITTGGTGLSPRDNTPEATSAVIDREAPGIAEAMRRETASLHPMAMLARGVCGVRGTSLIINLPGSPNGVEQCFAVIRPVLRHAIAQLTGHTSHEK